jgi:hypothetical protein
LPSDLLSAFWDATPGPDFKKLQPSAAYEDVVTAMMRDTVADMQQQAAKLLNKIENSNQGETIDRSSHSKMDNGSRDLQMEQLKISMQKLSAAQQAMSNVMNTLHENALNPIRNIKA